MIRWYDHIDEDDGTVVLKKELTSDGVSKKIKPATDAQLSGVLSSLQPYTKWHNEIVNLHKSTPQMKYGDDNAKSDSAAFVFPSGTDIYCKRYPELYQQYQRQRY